MPPPRFAAAVSAAFDGRHPPGKIAALMKSVVCFARSKLSSGTTMACSTRSPSAVRSRRQCAKKASYSRQSTASIISIATTLSNVALMSR